MSRTRTLAQLRSDVCIRADIVDGGSTGRHPSAELNRFINQAIQRYITLVSSVGGQNWYSKRTGLLSMGTSQTKDAAGWAPNMYVPLPSDFFELIGIDFTYGSSTWTLTQFSVAERNRFRSGPWWITSPSLGRPREYRIMGANAAGTQVAEVIPWSDGGAYQYEIRYIPEVADLSSDSDTFDGRAGFEEWIVNRAAMDALKKDASGATLYGIIAGENEQLEREMKQKFATMAEAGHRMDTESLRSWWFGDWRYP